MPRIVSELGERSWHEVKNEMKPGTQRWSWFSCIYISTGVYLPGQQTAVNKAALLAQTKELLLPGRHPTEPGNPFSTEERF